MQLFCNVKRKMFAYRNTLWNECAALVVSGGNRYKGYSFMSLLVLLIKGDVLVHQKILATGHISFDEYVYKETKSEMRNEDHPHQIINRPKQQIVNRSLMNSSWIPMHCLAPKGIEGAFRRLHKTLFHRNETFHNSEKLSKINIGR